ncbi:unnamed protein product [Symbiodinium sp. CCMP2592]|nr:unnamed protein product [Symbiodinium sp. CCMP2592]
MAGELAEHGEANGVAGGVVEEEALGEEVAKGAVLPSEGDAHPHVQAIDLQSLEYLASSPRTDLEGGETPVSLGMPFSARVRVEDPEALVSQASPSTEKAEEASLEEALPQTTESIPLPSPSSPRLEESESPGLQAEVVPLESLLQAEASPAKSTGSRPESLEGPLPSDTTLVPTAGQAEAPAAEDSQGYPAEASWFEELGEDGGDPRSEDPEGGVAKAASVPEAEPKDEAGPEVSEAKRRFEEVPMLPPDSFFQSDDLERLRLEAIDEARALLAWLVPGPGETLSPDEQEEVLRSEQDKEEHEADCRIRVLRAGRRQVWRERIRRRRERQAAPPKAEESQKGLYAKMRSQLADMDEEARALEESIEERNAELAGLRTQQQATRAEIAQWSQRVKELEAKAVDDRLQKSTSSAQALPARTGSTGSLLANRVVAGCPLAGCKSVSWMPPAGQVVTLPAFMAPLGSLQVPAGRTMLTSPGRSVTDGRASPAGVGSIPAGSLHLPPSHPNGTMLTSPGRTVKADGRASPAGVGSGLVGSLHLPPSHPNGLASPGGLLPPPTAKSPPPSHQAPQSPHQFAGKLPAHPATFVGTPPRAVGGTGPVLYPGSPGQLSPSTGSLVAPPALLSPQSFSLTVNPAQVSVGSPQCSARSPNLVRSANSFSSGSLPQRAMSPSPKVLPGSPYQAVAPLGMPGAVNCCTRSVSPSSVPLSPPGVRAPAPVLGPRLLACERLEVRATSAPVAKPLAAALGDAPVVASLLVWCQSRPPSSEAIEPEGLRVVVLGIGVSELS